MAIVGWGFMGLLTVIGVLVALSYLNPMPSEVFYC
jgi:hypothetical protein